MSCCKLKNLISFIYRSTSSHRYRTLLANSSTTPRNIEMTRKIIFSSLQWLDSRLCWEISISMLGMFILSCILQKLANKQGPMLWPVLGITPSLFLHFNNLYDWATESLIKAGGTFPFRGVWMGGVFGIVTANPSNIEYMLKTKFENFPKGKYYRERFSDFLGDGIFNADNELWKEQRRIATSEMHSRQFVERSFQTIKDLVHQKLLRLLDKLVEPEGSYFDLQEVLLRFTFDNICSAAFGTDPGCLALDLPQVPFAKAFEEAAELTIFRFLLPPFVWKPMRYFGIGYEKRLKEAIKIVHDFADKTLARRRNDFIKFGSLNNDHSDLLSRLIQDSESDHKKKIHFSDRLLRDLCISFVLAGRDTSSVALAWFFWLVHKNPEVETRILREINEILGSRKSKINELREVVFTSEELKRMVYLEAALSESLRLYPSVPIDVKEVKGDDVFPDGSRVKNGALVFYCAFSMARMESIWGKDCLEFKPERWIKEGQFVSENQYKYAVFNAGPRLCLGKKFAYMQMKMVAASILLRYEVKVVEGHKVEPKLTTTLYTKHGLLVTLNPRG